jgi:hypothetical protein
LYLSIYVLWGKIDEVWAISVWASIFNVFHLIASIAFWVSVRNNLTEDKRHMFCSSPPKSKKDEENPEATKRGQHQSNH